MTDIHLDVGSLGAIYEGIGDNARQISINSRNLIKLGDSQKRAKIHRDSIESKVGKGGGFNIGQIQKIIKDFHGDDINLIHTNLISLGNSQTKAKTQRDSIEGKVEDIFTRLTKKSSVTHSHAGFNILDQIRAGIIGGSISGIAVAGVIAYFFLRRT